MTDMTAAPGGLGRFERWLSVWVAAAILAGLLLGNLAPGLFASLAGMEVASVNLPVAVLIWAMVYPMMVGVDFGSIRRVGEEPRGLLITLVVAIGVAAAWFLVGKRDIPREAPREVSFATRAARADLYGDAINDAVVVRPGAALVGGLATFDRVGVDGAVEGGSSAVGGISQALRRLQNGFVRSYALSVLAGALLVVLALLAVNLR